MNKRFLSIAEFRSLSGIGLTKVYHLLGQGELTAVKAGRRTLIDAESAENYLNSLPRATFRTGTTTDSRAA